MNNENYKWKKKDQIFQFENTDQRRKQENLSRWCMLMHEMAIFPKDIHQTTVQKALQKSGVATNE